MGGGEGLEQLLHPILRSSAPRLGGACHPLGPAHLPQVQDVLDVTHPLVCVEDKVAAVCTKLSMALGVHELPA